MLRHKLQLAWTIQWVSPTACVGCRGILSLMIPEKISTPRASLERLPKKCFWQFRQKKKKKSQNQGQTCMLVITVYNSLNVTLTKIRHTEMEGSKTNKLQRFGRTEGNISLRNLRNRALPKKCETTALLSSNIYLGFQLLIFHAISFSKRPETFWAALAR